MLKHNFNIILKLIKNTLYFNKAFRKRLYFKTLFTHILYLFFLNLYVFAIIKFTPARHKTL